MQDRYLNLVKYEYGVGGIRFVNQLGGKMAVVLINSVKGLQGQSGGIS
mgnify:CR=1 FL=1